MQAFGHISIHSQLTKFTAYKLCNLRQILCDSDTLSALIEYLVTILVILINKNHEELRYPNIHLCKNTSSSVYHQDQLIVSYLYMLVKLAQYFLSLNICLDIDLAMLKCRVNLIIKVLQIHNELRS